MKRKFNIFGFLILIIFLTIYSINAQNDSNNEEYFRFPDDKFVSVKMIQNESPVQFQNIEVFFHRDGKMPLLTWKLKNNSAKSVKMFVVAFKIETNINKWLGFMGHTEYAIGIDEKSILIMPKNTYSEMKKVESSVMPNDELYNLFTFKKEWSDDMYFIIYGMVKKVVFDDGTVYEENSKTFKAI